MARRKVSENRSEEIQYRLLELVRHARAYGPMEIKVRYFAIRDLAKLWSVDLDSCDLEINDKTKVTILRSPKFSPEPVPEPVQGTVQIPEEKPLTPKPEGGILAEMGWGEKDGDQKD